MTFPSRLRDTVAGFLGRLLCTGLLVCGIGMASEPVYAATGTAVTVDDKPLIAQPTIPPNIMLMLDDSGSMAWDFMPDADYLQGKSKITCGRSTCTTVSADALRNAANNGTYYNPAVTYTPPPQAAPDAKGNPVLYAASPGLGSAFADGFLDTQTSDEVDVTQYSSTSLCDYNNATCSGAISTAFPYYQQLSKTTNLDNFYAATMACPSGSTLQTSGTNKGKCKVTQNGKTTYVDPSVPTCNSGDSYNSGKGQCDHITTTTATANLFTYTTLNSDGTYTRYYVGKSDTDCAVAPAGTCDSSTATQQNVANWFSYYRTRILMAKSGLMSAFATIDKSYRVGFGSIDGNGSANLPNKQTITGTTIKVAPVSPFGDGSKTTDQRNAFWTWVSKESANNGTPLRTALDAVGQYYQSDGPWKTMSTDPDQTVSEYACRQSYTILTTDGFWNDTGYTGPGDVDGTTATVTGPNGSSYTYTPALPYSDVSNVSKNGYSLTTLADVAMKYWVTDLRPKSTNSVPTSTDDPAFWQHMVTFTLGLGFQPLYSDQKTVIPMDTVFSWANGTAGDAISGFAWPLPSTSGTINNIADLAHAAVNGHGGFYTATSPSAFTNGLKAALNRAASRVGSGASLAANSTQLTSGTFAYQATYHTSTWVGDLAAYAINPTTGVIATTASWTASSKLPTAANRNIYTYNPTAGTYLAFKVSSTGTLPAISSAQLSALGADTATQTNMINYLRGDATNETSSPSKGPYRSRSTPIGDIVSSQPVFVGAPTANQFYGETFTGTSSYTTYASTGTGGKAGRAPTVYVASNDGFLHAFDASTGSTGGTETYAYLPGAVITSNLKTLSDPTYGVLNSLVDHQYFNDGELTVADVYLSGAWKTVLVGTTGRGLAQAVYALDITDPTNIQFMWERSASDGQTNSNYIGQMTGKPVIAMTADDGATKGATWSVLMGNGYNSTAGKAALLQFNLADGSLNVHATTDTTGLAAPAVWMSAPTTGVSDVAYAGDLDGHVWSFSLQSSGGTTSDTATPNSNGVLLFTATDGTKAQPITAGMLVGKDSQSNTWVFFGTGKYLTASDLSDKSVQSWYGIVVKAATNSSYPAISSQTNKDRSSLAQRYITAETSGTATSQGARTVTTTTDATSMTGKSGWFIDLEQPTGSGSGLTYTAQGERMVTPNQFQGSLLLGTTRIPVVTDPCSPTGSGWVMAVDPFTGTNPQSSFFDLDGNGTINSADTVNGVPAAGINFTSLPNNPIFVGGTMLMSFDNGTNSSIQTSGGGNKVNRVSWRELINQ